MHDTKTYMTSPIGVPVILSVVLHLAILIVSFSGLSSVHRNPVHVLLVDDPSVKPQRTREHVAAPTAGLTPFRKESAVRPATRNEERLKGSDTNAEPLIAQPMANAAREEAQEVTRDIVPSSHHGEIASVGKEGAKSSGISVSPGGTSSSAAVGGGPGGRVGASKGSSLPLEGAFGTPGGPSFIHQEKPSYPFVARKLGKEGRVLLRLTIDEKGRLTDIEVIERAGYGFTEAAIEAVKRSVFSPAQRDGRPTTSKALLPVRFVLRDG